MSGGCLTVSAPGLIAQQAGLGLFSQWKQQNKRASENQGLSMTELRMATFIPTRFY